MSSQPHRFYHITSGLKEWLEIKKKGLRFSKDGYIYLLTRKDIAPYVAKNQLLISGYYRLIEVNPKGITGIIENDNVGEITVKYQKRVRQDKIKPQFLKLVNMYKIKNPRPDRPISDISNK